MAKFELAVNKIYKYECPPKGSCYVNDPNDPGGETNWGISKRAFPDVNIKNLTKDEATKLYMFKYWMPMRLNEVHSQEMAEEMLDIGVNMGNEVAVRLAQWAYNLLTNDEIHMDGKIGPVTLGALNGHPFPRSVTKAMNGLQFSRYVMIVANNPKQKKYFRSWLRRVEFTEGV